MPSHHPPLPKVPEPTKVFFDPFNSSSTGHQRAENKNRLSGSTSWRNSRTYKLSHQFRDATGVGGADHLSDLVGAGSENYKKDGKKDNGDWQVGAPGLREGGWQDIRDLLGKSRKRTADCDAPKPSVLIKKRRVCLESLTLSTLTDDHIELQATADTPRVTEVGNHVDDQDAERPQIFRGLTMYLNGSTMPLVSDHKLKQLFAQHGGNAAIVLGRRKVTHVILGEQGRGGGLAASKIQKENTTTRGKGLKYVSAQWILDSIEKGIRQPESRYMVSDVKNKLGGSRQSTIATLFRGQPG